MVYNHTFRKDLGKSICFILDKKDDLCQFDG